jgi:hypothetical protein
MAARFWHVNTYGNAAYGSRTSKRPKSGNFRGTSGELLAGAIIIVTAGNGPDR